MLWKRGLVACGAWLVGATALSAVALTLNSAAALSPFGVQRFSGSVVGGSILRAVAAHVAAVSLWLGLVAATDRESWKSVPWLTFAMVVPLTLLSVVLAVPIALLVTLTQGVGPAIFWTNTVENLEVRDLVVGLIRSGLFGLVLYGLARVLLGYLHGQVLGTFWKFIIAWLIVSCALAPVDVIFSIVRAA